MVQVVHDQVVGLLEVRVVPWQLVHVRLVDFG